MMAETMAATTVAEKAVTWDANGVLMMVAQTAATRAESSDEKKADPKAGSSAETKVENLAASRVSYSADPSERYLVDDLVVWKAVTMVEN